MSARKTIRQAIKQATDEHGGHNKAAQVLGIDASYLGRLRDGSAWPSAETLERLGLTVCSIDAAVQPKVGRRDQAQVDRAIALREAELQKSYVDHVKEEATRIMPDEFRQQLKQAREDADHSREVEGIWRHRSISCKQMLDTFFDSYRVITSALHPDRAPEDRRTQFTKAMEAINLIKQAAEKAKKVF